MVGVSSNKQHSRDRRLSRRRRQPPTDFEQGTPRIRTDACAAVTTSSRYRGVTRVARAGGAEAWQAQSYHSGRNHHLGTFDTEEYAAYAYDRAAHEHRGDRRRSTYYGSAAKLAVEDALKRGSANPTFNAALDAASVPAGAQREAPATPRGPGRWNRLRLYLARFLVISR